MSSSVIRVRNARGELVEPAKISSTDAKNRFGKILERVTDEGGVAITLRNEPKFVVISVETYQRLARADSRSLNTLTEEFDALLDRMQEPDSRAAMERAFSMTPEELGQAARRQGGITANRHMTPATSSQTRKGKALRGVSVTLTRKPAGRTSVLRTNRGGSKKAKHRARG
jgi:prevent-host-death family protein